MAQAPPGFIRLYAYGEYKFCLMGAVCREAVAYIIDGPFGGCAVGSRTSVRPRGGDIKPALEALADALAKALSACPPSLIIVASSTPAVLAAVSAALDEEELATDELGLYLEVIRLIDLMRSRGGDVRPVRVWPELDPARDLVEKLGPL